MKNDRIVNVKEKTPESWEKRTLHSKAKVGSLLLVHIRKPLILLASQVSCEALRIKRPQVRILLGAPQTADTLSAVGGCFLCLVFLGIVGF